jgi:transcriptional regulator of acetoin/glycerol metabolism
MTGQAGLVNAQRPEIRRSWERSRSCGIDPEADIELPYDPELGSEERFMRAAAPVMDELADMLIGSDTSAVLLDAQGRVLVRRCDRSLERRLDRTNSIPGFYFHEQHIGTNAVGIALEERKPAWVVADEHWSSALRHLACAAIPITHPITLRLQGLLDITACVEDASRHMLPVAKQAAQAIEKRLYEDSSESERLLLARFLAAANRPGRSVVVLGERLELSTPPAARLLDVTDKTLLWERASELVRERHTSTEQLALSNGREVSARFERVERGGRAAGVVVELSLASASRASAKRSAEAPKPRTARSFVGRSGASRYLREQAELLSEQHVPVMIVGETGTGKLELAKAMVGDQSDRVLLDASRATTPAAVSELVERAAQAIEQPRTTVIVRRVGGLPAMAMDALTSMAISAEAVGSRMVATHTISPEQPTWTPAATFGLKLDLPPLRERADDLVDLVPHLIERRGGHARMAPAAIQALMRYDWPGNVRELDNLIRVLLTRKRTTDIVLADLPPAYQSGSHRLRRIDQVERAAIVQALQEARGNKTRAAELLEIGRATLYRKMRSYGLDLEATTG